MCRFAHSLALGVVVMVGAIAATACESNTTASPSSSSSTGSVTAPLPAQPSANASVRFADQPVTLVVQNAALTKSTGTVYTFEVATDSAFAAMVQTKDSIAEGTAGQAAVKLHPPAGAQEYTHRPRASRGATPAPRDPAAATPPPAPRPLHPPP